MELPVHQQLSLLFYICFFFMDKFAKEISISFQLSGCSMFSVAYSLDLLILFITSGWWDNDWILLSNPSTLNCIVFLSLSVPLSLRPSLSSKWAYSGSRSQGFYSNMAKVFTGAITLHSQPQPTPGSPTPQNYFLYSATAIFPRTSWRL